MYRYLKKKQVVSKAAERILLACVILTSHKGKVILKGIRAKYVIAWFKLNESLHQALSQEG